MCKYATKVEVHIKAHGLFLGKSGIVCGAQNNAKYTGNAREMKELV